MGEESARMQGEHSPSPRLCPGVRSPERVSAGCASSYWRGGRTSDRRRWHCRRDPNGQGQGWGLAPPEAALCPKALRHATGQCLSWGQRGEDLSARVALPVGSGHCVQATLAKEAIWVRPVSRTCVCDGHMRRPPLLTTRVGGELDHSGPARGRALALCASIGLDRCRGTVRMPDP